ncbi:hypothetical protein IB238_11530 [Rhizobium sp. ARZ01]|uniref:DUF6455 family protein n=1 Tax=Rhizobium sp. ARZ01 TaxID=2769313 RepID=UPI0017847432|nr:DUF6455 family protein [Rhizobium sp. ARZ01]MBD9373249.1 hypothetical protein [Rhizobium sp. ARZ01]
MLDHSLMHVFEMMAARWKGYRDSAQMLRNLTQLGPREIGTIAADCGLTSEQFCDVVGRGPHAADELGNVMTALGINAEALQHKDRTAFNDMTRVCAACSHKAACRRSIRNGTIVTDHVAFCNNSDVLAEFQRASGAVRMRSGTKTH